MNEFEKMKNGLLYNPIHNDLVKPHYKGLNGSLKFNMIPFNKTKKRQKLLNKLIPSSIGKNFNVFNPFYFEYGVNIEIGMNCFCNFNCVFLDVNKIKIGDNVMFGANVTLATPVHPLVASERIVMNYPDGYHDLEYSKPITIEDNCWISSNVTICGGVTIGKNSVVAAGAVVTKNMPSNSIIAGIPAKVIREISDEDRIDVWNTYINEELPLTNREKNK